MDTLPTSSSARLRRPVTVERSMARLPSTGSRQSSGLHPFSYAQDRSSKSTTALRVTSPTSRVPLAGTPRAAVDATGSRRDARASERRPQQISDKKGPRLVAMLKSTWQVLKRPFKF
ncbi:MAG TPA: hypothetical protein VJT71_06240 [Pyrinomonadaceae bacterium]|nr:hypothetical protein [Pyrinomonadaceae bacterium]